MNEVTDLGRWLDYGLLTTVKSTVVLGVAWAVAGGLRRRPAAEKHMVWAFAVAGIIPLPVFGGAPLPWRVELPLPEWGAAGGTSVSPRLFPDADEGESGLRGDVGDVPTMALGEAGATGTSVSSGSAESSTGPISLAGAALSVWLLGLLFFVVRGVLGVFRAILVPRRARIHRDSATIARAARIAGESGIGQRIRLLEGRAGEMPKTAGLIRPWLLLPEDAAAWPPARLDAVLRHELAHVRRRDPLTELIVQLACALYWFHPLVWYAAGRVRAEREHACDDVVLLSGTRASDYAKDLLAIATETRSRRLTALIGSGAIAMARPSRLRDRLTAVLDDRPRAGGMDAKRGMPAVAAALTLLFLIGATGPSPRDALSIHLERKLLIDGHQVEFGRLEAIIADDDGRIYVADTQRQTQEIVVLDPAGRRVATFGRAGSGPGEFTGLQGALAWAGDNLLAVDGLQQRITLFNRSGGIVATRRWPDEKYSTYHRLFSGGSRAFGLALFRPSVVIRSFDEPRVPVSTEVQYLEFAPNGSSVPLPLQPFDRFVPGPTGDQCATADRSSIYGFPEPFHDRGPLMAFLPGGEMAVAHRDEYVVEIIDVGSGRVVRRHRREVSPLPLTDAIWEAQPSIRGIRDAERESGGRLSAPGGGPCSILQRRPEFQPILRTLVSDDSGRLWIEATGANGFIFTGIDQNGRLIGDTPMPARDPRVAPYVRGNLLYLVTADDLGVQSIEVYEIRIG